MFIDLYLIICTFRRCCAYFRL